MREHQQRMNPAQYHYAEAFASASRSIKCFISAYAFHDELFVTCLADEASQKSTGTDDTLNNA